MKRLVSSLATAAILSAAPAAMSHQPALRPQVDATLRHETINGVLRLLSERYVFPAVAKQIEKHVQQRVAAKAYDSITDGNALAQALTTDLRSISHDLHLSVSYSAEVLPPQSAEPENPTPEQWEEMRTGQARDNYGLARAEVLPGNVGYLDFLYFTSPKIAGDTYAGAMAVVANSHALIIDLRRCGGSGSVDAIPFLCTYLFEKPVHLNDIYWRESDSTRQFWTLPSVPGRRYLNKPVYVLTSRHTFSGAEEMAYDLQNLKRATIVGDVTGGGANPGGTRRVNDHFAVWVPVGRAINPYSKTNWEGKGVVPDMKIPASQALVSAHVAALQELVAKEKNPALSGPRLGTIAELERAKGRFRKITFFLPGFPEAREVNVAGSFNFWSTRTNPLMRQGDAWVGEVVLEPGEHTYKFVVDGNWLKDPANPKSLGSELYENSVIDVK